MVLQQALHRRILGDQGSMPFDWLDDGGNGIKTVAGVQLCRWDIGLSRLLARIQWSWV